ncbi:hypothetical protein SAMN04488564_101886 [Lentzea waywayandensis]|uniref:Uncharacterized protein n=1 Tax=Lentzea waywayandensis TaxID=84724 RepID=A0A1I6D2J7_9PSEU|nr:hypothetical protein [Lentzea waywayandensis]SFQ99572.1 hypothetical protein SAMN04488564_101886 [Lentzea waywayandensis]
MIATSESAGLETGLAAEAVPELSDLPETIGVGAESPLGASQSESIRMTAVLTVAGLTALAALAAVAAVAVTAVVLAVVPE